LIKMNKIKQPYTYNWRLFPQENEQSARLAQGLQVPLPVAQVLLNRGISSVGEGKAFLAPNLAQLHSPFLMQDMACAVEIIITALRQGKRMAIYGDYDVDGITATALLYSLLQEWGADVIAYLPDRLTEGYGLNDGALDYLHDQAVSLLITVDCGISNVAEVGYASRLGLEVIITDHHRPANVLPAAAAVLNPWRKDCSYPFAALCGAGIAFKLGQALCCRLGREERVWKYLDLVALGTVADVVPLQQENRVLVVSGLQQMDQNLRPGLEAVRSVSGIKNKKITATEIAFFIAPRLNAAGRLGDARRAFDLLLAGKEEEADLLARELQTENNRRQALEAKIFKEASALVAESAPAEVGRNFLLLAREGWHPGVLGIVASRLVERFNRPAMLVGLEGGKGRGSGRSYGDFDLGSALKSCSILLQGFGGHRQAAGITLAAENIIPLREKLDFLAGDFFGEAGPSATLCLDARLEPEEVTPELVRALQLLEPWGHDNPPPLFWGKGWQLKKRREVGKGGQHLQLGVQKRGQYFAGISFNGRSKFPLLLPGQEVELAFSVSFDEWRGHETLQLEILDCLYTGAYQGKKDLGVIDRRGLKEKMHYIKELRGQGADILILVNTAGRREHLARVFAGMPGIYFSHQGAWPPGGLTRMPGHFVLFDLPLSEKRLKESIARLQALNQEKKELVVHLLFDRRDYQENLKLLRATVPAFSSLEQVFFFLQKNAGVKGNLPREKIAGILQKALPFPVTRHLLKKSMGIFAEALYLELNEQGVYLKRRVDDYCSLHKDLAGIQTFRMERDKWKHTLAWQQFLLESTGEKILSSLSDFTPRET
jgi:single-stranded-DNA-specific exonuclease RecJ